ncbi:MAG: terpene synthase family protein [Methylococcales bacterium]
MRRFQLVENDQAFERIRLSKFGWLAARAYPNAPLDRLQIVSDWNTWLFILDDRCDECGLGKHPDRLSALHSRCLETLLGKEPEPVDQPLVYALHDIYRRLQPFASLVWLTRFTQSASEYFEATLWEAKNRFHKRWPDMACYVRMRPHTGGLHTDIEFIEITEQINLSCIVRTHPRLKQLIVITNNVVCWSNDIISLKKEQAHDDMHNLVLIRQQESGIGLQESLNQVKRLIDHQIQRFLILEKRLPVFGGEIDQDVARFVAVLRSWMRGNLDWAYESGRYSTQTADKSHSRTDSYENASKKIWAVGSCSQIDVGFEADLPDR